MDLENEYVRATTNFAVKEADFILQPNLSPCIAALFKLQVTGNLNTAKSWGTIALDKACVMFSPARSPTS